jgi:Na+-translocating ferredoxin:NAD+ oxidoreductase RnfD subunit
MSAFLFFGTLAAFYAGVTLIWRGTALDRLWAFNPRAFAELSTYGRIVGVPFLALAIALLISGIGWMKRRRWGWILAVILIVSQVLGGLAHLFTGRLAEGAVGVIIAGALLIYLLRPPVRSAFL